MCFSHFLNIQMNASYRVNIDDKQIHLIQIWTHRSLTSEDKKNRQKVYNCYLFFIYDSCIQSYF